MSEQGKPQEEIDLNAEEEKALDRASDKISHQYTRGYNAWRADQRPPADATEDFRRGWDDRDEVESRRRW